MEPQINIEKTALNCFSALAGGVLALCLGFCFFTERFTEMGVVFGGTALLAFIIISTYQSFK